MLWDVSPLGDWTMYEGRNELADVAVKVLEFALENKNDAVIESALHGLGHAVFAEIVPSASIIDRFIQQRHGAVRKELITYARQAQTGRIL